MIIDLLVNNIIFKMILLPIVGCIFVTLIPVSKQSFIKFVGLFFSILTLILSLIAWVLMSFINNTTSSGFFSKQWCFFDKFLNICFAIDGISIFFILLTTFLVVICLLSGWEVIEKNIKGFIISFLSMETLLIITFTVLDIFAFYIFFESVLIPMFIIVGIWGSRERKIKAAYQFFLYTLIGSLFMLIGILVIYFQVGTTDYFVLYDSNLLSEKRQLFLWLMFFCSFAVKVPMIPFHIWLPEAHVEAPTSGSVILAGILLKLGTYGLLRFSVSLFPLASLYFAPFVYIMSIISIVYGSLTTLRQIDLKRIIAYSSVAHMGFVTIGLFSFDIHGLVGSIMLMISHGLVSGALFLCIGVIYDRYHTRMIKYYGGLVKVMPIFSIIFLFFILANIGLPGTSSFVAEFLTLIGAFKDNSIVTFLASTGVILGAGYSIVLYNKVIFGKLNFIYIKNYNDLTKREFFIFVPLVLLVVWLGINTNPFLDTLYSSCYHSLTNVFAKL